MGGDLLGEEQPSPTDTPQSMTEVFYEHFPYYLALGMTEWQYWHGDCTLVKHYREAEKIRNRKKNSEFHLQGMYIYEALVCVSPLLHAFAKKGTKAHPYTDKPYPLDNVEAKKYEEEKRKKEKARAREVFDAMVAALAARGLKEESEGIDD